MLYWSRLQLNLDCVYNLPHNIVLAGRCESRFSVYLGFSVSSHGKYLQKNSPRSRIPASKVRSKAAFFTPVHHTLVRA